ncbi:U3 small nucleolar RNA-associated protein 6 homolog [Hydractinia symbiolongicarpus]|uniref:U3 small nucleolar RNA-associated protein 6 homolog n=1 Tax=Hydractinia symbiolongicarpus TaxID=13093 RepID=UPI00254EA36A|nr:U3 small nucleolar RNA-associated protein 6 homolog [Hydractinia symbiolongicarpus]
MAEVVFQSLEGMLPELEDLERQGLFTREELRIIIKRRTDFEYKLQKRIMDKVDILNYLEYELKLDLLRKKRCKRLKLKPYSTSALAVTNRIHTLFRKALLKFGDDLKLWMQYLDFCKKTESVRAMGSALGKMIQKHSSNQEVWLLAAKFELEEANNVENARSLLQRALRVHKLSKKLWHESFRLELLHVDKIKKRRKLLGVGGIELKDIDENEPKELDSFLANKTARIVFENAIKIIPDDLRFRLDFLNVCARFEDTDELEEGICQSALADYRDEEEIHEAISKLPLIRLKKQLDRIIKDEEWIKSEDDMSKRFQQAVTKLNTSSMWEKYLNAFGELLHESTSPQQAKRRIALIKNIFASAEENKLATESMYIFWIDLLVELGDTSEAMKFLCRALEMYKQNALLWKTYLLLKAGETDQWSELKNEFKKCTSTLNQGCSEIYQMYIDCAMKVDVEETERIFEELMNGEQKDLKNLFLPQYLDWLHSTKGIKKTRKVYKKLLQLSSELEVIEKCLSIEELQDDVSVKHVRSLHEKAVDDYGNNNADVWLSYLKFEKQLQANDLERTGMIYNKARRTLEGKHNAEFLTRYSLLQSTQ